MTAPPSGTVTFLLTDVEASTRAWQSDPSTAAAAMARHDEIVASAVAAHGGYRPIEQGEGDSTVAAFARASDAVAAALEAQLALQREPWPPGAPLRVRMAIHTGEAEAHDGRYAGTAIIRTARLRALAHGGQTILSRPSAEMAGETLPAAATLVDLGTYRLGDLARPERVFQLGHPELRDTFGPLRSPERVTAGLPAPLSSFVGREAELARAEQLLAAGRLLTLTGPGGCGKTRLAAHLAARISGSYPAGVWWVDLAPLATGSGISTAVLATLGIGEHPSRPALDQLAGHLGPGPGLLVVDNCEHVLDAVNRLVEPLLGRCPELTVLATSRELLGIPGETAWAVPPLCLPPASGHGSTPAGLGGYDAVALFLERARQARPNFILTDDNAPLVAEICRRLDGMPLALELAAARVRVLSLEEIRAGLDDRFRLLVRGSKTADRRQSLAASVAWSFELLSETERALLGRLSVFAGGFTLEAAEAVGSGDGIDPLEVLDRLASLVDKSIVIAGGDTGADTRYALLETIREYAAGELAAAGATPAVRNRHLDFGLRLAIAADDRFLADDTLAAQLEAEHDNLLTALDWALAGDRLDEAVGLVVGLGHLWLARGWYGEATTWFDRLLGHPGTAHCPVAFRARWVRVMLALFDGRWDRARGLDAEVLEQARAAGDRRYLARALTVHGCVQAMVHPPTGEATLAEAVAAADDVDDPISAVLARLFLIVCGIHRDDHAAVARHLDAGGGVFAHATRQMRSFHLALAGWSAWRLGRFDEARRSARMARALAAEVSDSAFAGALVALTVALVELSQGRMDEAVSVLEPALGGSRAAGSTREDAMLTGCWGRVLAAGGRLDEAEAAVAEAVRLAERIGDGLQYLFCLAWQAGLLRLRGRTAPARAAAEAMLASARHQENLSFEAGALRELGHLARLDGDLDRADDLARRGLALSVEAGLLPDVAGQLVAVAGVAAAEESWEEAARLFSAAATLRGRLGAVPDPWDQLVLDADLELVRGGLDPDGFDAAWAEGSALDVDVAVAYALRGRGERKRPSTGWASLTPTERQVVDLLTEGLRNTEIAERLFVAPSTVKTHLSHIFAKLGVANRAGLAALAARRGERGSATA